MGFTKTGKNIWRDFVGDGIPGSGINDPHKPDIRKWSTEVESLTSLPFQITYFYSSKDALLADLGPSENASAGVVGDPTAGNDGLYKKNGISGAGSWTQLTSYIPGTQIVTAANSGTGTVNAIETTSFLAIGATGNQLIVVDVPATNTASPVTIKFNGGSFYTIKTVTGADVIIGALPLRFVGIIGGVKFNLLSDVASSSFASAAAASAISAASSKVDAQAARDAALVSGPKYTTEALGRAAVADGAVFMVQGLGNVAAYEYRRVNSTTSTLIATYAALSAVESASGPVIFTTGRSGTPVTGTTASIACFVFNKPQLHAGVIERFRFFGVAGLTAGIIKVFRLDSGGVMQQVGSDVSVAAGSGVKEFSRIAGDFASISVKKGDFLGFYSTGAGITFAPGALPTSDTYFTPAGNPSSFTPGLVASAGLLALGFDVSSSELTARADIESNRRISKQNGDSKTTYIGRMITPADGVAGSNLTYLFADKTPGEGVIDVLNVWSKGAGIISILVYDELSTKFIADGPPVHITLVDGLNSLSVAAGTMAFIPFKKGQRLGFNMATRVCVTSSMVGDSGGYYASSVGLLPVFAKGAVITAPRIEIGFGITYFDNQMVRVKQMLEATYTADAKLSDTFFVVHAGLTLPKLYLGATALNTVSGTPVMFGITIGDSTIAERLGRTAVSGLIAGYSSQELAAGGETIVQQHYRFNALVNINKFQVVVVQVGLNDITATGTAVAAIKRLQNMVDQIRQRIDPACKIYIGKMLPCKARWDVLFPGNAGVSQQQWVDCNEAIAGAGATPITGVDGRIVAHVPLLDDGAGNLASIYNTGDGIHENLAGAQIIANAWKTAIGL